MADLLKALIVLSLCLEQRRIAGKTIIGAQNIWGGQGIEPIVQPVPLKPENGRQEGADQHANRSNASIPQNLVNRQKLHDRT